MFLADAVNRIVETLRDERLEETPVQTVRKRSRRRGKKKRPEDALTTVIIPGPPTVVNALLIPPPPSPCPSESQESSRKGVASVATNEAVICPPPSGGGLDSPPPLKTGESRDDIIAELLKDPLEGSDGKNRINQQTGEQPSKEQNAAILMVDTSSPHKLATPVTPKFRLVEESAPSAAASSSLKRSRSFDNAARVVDSILGSSSHHSTTLLRGRSPKPGRGRNRRRSLSFDGTTAKKYIMEVADDARERNLSDTSPTAVMSEITFGSSSSTLSSADGEEPIIRREEHEIVMAAATSGKKDEDGVFRYCWSKDGSSWGAPPSSSSDDDDSSEPPKQKSTAEEDEAVAAAPPALQEHSHSAPLWLNFWGGGGAAAGAPTKSSQPSLLDDDDEEEEQKFGSLQEKSIELSASDALKEASTKEDREPTFKSMTLAPPALDRHQSAPVTRNWFQRMWGGGGDEDNNNTKRSHSESKMKQQEKGKEPEVDKLHEKPAGKPPEDQDAKAIELASPASPGIVRVTTGGNEHHSPALWRHRLNRQHQKQQELADEDQDEENATRLRRTPSFPPTDSVLRLHPEDEADAEDGHGTAAEPERSAMTNAFVAASDDSTSMLAAVDTDRLAKKQPSMSARSRGGSSRRKSSFDGFRDSIKIIVQDFSGILQQLVADEEIKDLEVFHNSEISVSLGNEAVEEEVVSEDEPEDEKPSIFFGSSAAARRNRAAAEALRNFSANDTDDDDDDISEPNNPFYSATSRYGSTPPRPPHSEVGGTPDSRTPSCQSITDNAVGMSPLVNWEASGSKLGVANSPRQAMWKHLHHQQEGRRLQPPTGAAAAAGNDSSIQANDSDLCSSIDDDSLKLEGQARGNGNPLLGYGGMSVRYPSEQSVDLHGAGNDEHGEDSSNHEESEHTEASNDDIKTSILGDYNDNDEDDEEEDDNDGKLFSVGQYTNIKTAASMDSDLRAPSCHSVTQKAVGMQPLVNWDAKGPSSEAPSPRQAMWKHLHNQEHEIFATPADRSSFSSLKQEQDQLELFSTSQSPLLLYSSVQTSRTGSNPIAGEASDEGLTAAVDPRKADVDTGAINTSQPSPPLPPPPPPPPHQQQQLQHDVYGDDGTSEVSTVNMSISSELANNADATTTNLQQASIAMSMENADSDHDEMIPKSKSRSGLRDSLHFMFSDLATEV